MRNAKRVLCLIGPTASGKSGLALNLAQSGLLGPIDIVSLDSAQVYRGMDIGTAKPTSEERECVTHHLIDCCDPEDSYSVAQYLHDINKVIPEIWARDRIPLIVGGTMLYFKALVEGLDALPSSPSDIRQAIAAEAKNEGWPALHAKLNVVDPITAQRLAPQDAQRISRALEVWQATGKPLSSYVQSPNRLYFLAPLDVIALQPENRAWLHDRIKERFDCMVAKGLIEEVRDLMKRPGLTGKSSSMRSVGYRQAWRHILGETSYGDFLSQGLAATRQLAKRQMTWLRSFNAIKRLDPSGTSETFLIEKIKSYWAE